jgi:hypothetical protein
MKYSILTGLILMASCSHQLTNEELLKNDNTRKELMTAISNDHAMATEMINYLSNSSASADMMKSNCDFMKSEKAAMAIKKDTALQSLMISNMFFMLRNDSALCDKTCTQISMNPQIDSILQYKRNTVRK